MPKEYTNCVASYVKDGVATDVAKARCAAAYYKKHKMTVKQAHAKGIEEDPMTTTEEVVLKEIDTYARKRELVAAALRARYGYPDDVGLPYSGPYIVDIADTQVVVVWKSRLFEILYEIDSRQEVALGEMRELQRAYITAEEIAHVRQTMAEGWLPAGITLESLEDDDFAWVSFKYAAATAEERAKLVGNDHRKLPYKIAGSLNRAGWVAAWVAASWNTYLQPVFEGGPSRKAVLAKLRVEKPKDIKVASTGELTGLHESSNGWRTSIAATLFNTDELIIEETEDAKGPFTVTGTALIDGAISRNGRYYSAEFNDVAMKATNKFMKEGGIVTVYSRHARALPKSSDQFGLPDGLPVGKVSVPLWREGKRIKYKAIVVETAEGRDVQELIRKNVMPGTSIRSVARYKSRMGKVDGRVLEVMEWAVIEGIDLTDNPGIAGAGIESFLEEASQVVSITAEEGTDMSELDSLTLDQLREQRPDLLEAVVGPLTTRIADLEAAKPKDPIEETPAPGTETPAAETPVADLKMEEVQGQLVVAGNRIKELEFELQLQQAAQQDVGKVIVEELRKEVASADEIAAKLPEIRTRAIQAFLESALPKGATEGTTVGGKTGGTLEETPASTRLSPAQQEIVGYAS